MSMLCPICKSKSKCKDTRMKQGFSYRRYQCDADIHHRWTTVEVVVVTGSGNAIDVQKVFEGIAHGAAAVQKLNELKAKVAALLHKADYS